MTQRVSEKQHTVDYQFPVLIVTRDDEEALQHTCCDIISHASCETLRHCCVGVCGLFASRAQVCVCRFNCSDCVVPARPWQPLR